MVKKYYPFLTFLIFLAAFAQFIIIINRYRDEITLPEFDIVPLPTPTSILSSDKLLISPDNQTTYFYKNGQKYLYDQKPVDYPGKIIFSPDTKFACIEYGTSGYWGYHLFDLNSQKTILSGPQYSYCQAWNNSVLTVKEELYNGFNTQIYQINTTTLQKKLVSNVKNSKPNPQ